MLCFQPCEADLCSVLILFERQLKFLKTEEDMWMTYLIGSLPNEITKWITKEPDKKFRDFLISGVFFSNDTNWRPKSLESNFHTVVKVPIAHRKISIWNKKNSFEVSFCENRISTFEQLQEIIVSNEMKE